MAVVAAPGGDQVVGQAGEGLLVTVDSVAAFRSASIPADTEKVTIRGYYGPNTLGGGDFLIDRADTTTADNGGTVLVNADGLRVKRPQKQTLYHTTASEVD